MNILKVKARGFIGFKSGLGLDEIEIDMSGISGLIAIAGGNGMGKTTLLEVCSPYRTMASRKGKLNEHVFLRDSFKEVTFELDGDEYRCLVKIDSGSDRSEGFIYKNGSDSSLVNGKLGQYDDFIEGLLGSQNLFYSSVFCAQNATKLSDMRPTEIKQLFVEFLNIRKYEVWEQSAKQAGAFLAGKSKSIADQIEKTSLALFDLGNTENTISELKESIFNFERMIRDISTEIESHRETLDGLKAKELENKAITEKGIALNEQMESIKTKLRNYTESFKFKSLDLNRRISEISLDIQKYMPFFLLKDAINEADSNVALNNEIIGSKRSLCFGIENSISDRHEVLRNLTEAADLLSSELKNLTDHYLAQSQELQNQMNDIKSNNDKLSRDILDLESDRELERLKSDLSRCESQIKAMDGIDPACVSTSCRFITTANESKSNIESIKKTIDHRKSEITCLWNSINTNIESNTVLYENLNSERYNLTTAYNIDEAVLSRKINLIKLDKIASVRHEISNSEKELKEHRTFIETLQSKNKEYAELASKKNELSAAESAIAELEKSKAQAMSDIAETNEKFKVYENDFNKEIQSIDAKIIQLRSTYTPNVSAQIQEISTKIIESEKNKDAASINKNSAIARIEIEEEKLRSIKKIKDEIAELEAKKEATESEIATWNYLQYACSKKGLQILEIDGVTPLILRDANDILHSSFGGEFTLRIITKDEETGAEVFQIKVIKSDGSEVLIENLSGGQKVWNLKALRLAMTLISKEKSGKHLKTAFADEEDGALDEEKASSFIFLYRAFMSTGCFDKCLFISHRADVIAKADHIINFTPKGIMVN